MPPECHRHHPYAAPHVPITNQNQRKTDCFGLIRNRNRTQVDYTASVVRHVQNRISHPDAVNNPSISFAAKFVRSCTNFKTRRAPINRVLWAPSGRRVITGDHNGDFTLWDGESFHLELIVEGHEKATRSMAWSYDDENWISRDDGGAVKYWKSNMTNVLLNDSAHQEAVRDLSFARTNLKFCSCLDDTTVKIWDFETCKKVHTLTRHGWNVRSVDWHPTNSLVASGGKDSVVKLWDARTGRELCSFYDHKNWVHSVKWNPNGNLLLTASKDHTIKLYDMRAMKELESFRGHGNQVTALSWHPYREGYFVSGSGDGSIFHWLVGQEAPQVEVSNAHNGSNNSSVWDLQWHPMGHLLCSGSNDSTTKFWCKNSPGDHKSNINENKCFGALNSAVSGHMFSNFPIPSHEVTSTLFAKREGTIIPGVGIAIEQTKH